MDIRSATSQLNQPFLSCFGICQLFLSLLKFPAFSQLFLKFGQNSSKTSQFIRNCPIYQQFTWNMSRLPMISQEQYKIFTQMPSGWKSSPTSFTQIIIFMLIEWKQNVYCEKMSYYWFLIKCNHEITKITSFVIHVGYDFHPVEPYLMQFLIQTIII